MSIFDQATEAADELAAGDEVASTEEVLRHISEQVENLGGGESVGKDPLGHISVPRSDPYLPLPAGEVTINFRDGFVEHEGLGYVTRDLVTVEDLSDRFDGQSAQLRNIIFHTDTDAEIQIGKGGQYVPLDYVPLPSESFDTVKINLGHPGNLLVLASTQELPIGIGAINLYASRYGEQSGTLDSPKAVPLSPHALWKQYGSAYADSTLWTAAYDSTTFTVENTSGNGNDVEAIIEANESPSTGMGKWREIASDTIIDGDHSTFHVKQRHHAMRARLTNTATGNSVSGTVETQEGSP